MGAGAFVCVLKLKANQRNNPITTVAIEMALNDYNIIIFPCTIVQ